MATTTFHPTSKCDCRFKISRCWRIDNCEFSFNFAARLPTSSIKNLQPRIVIQEHRATNELEPQTVIQTYSAAANLTNHATDELPSATFHPTSQCAHCTNTLVAKWQPKLSSKFTVNLPIRQQVDSSDTQSLYKARCQFAVGTSSEFI